jgi:hypothetical protein
MTNHPNRKRSYWYLCPRGFANEYSIGVATTDAGAAHYKSAGYERVTKAYAMREMVDRGDAATQRYVGVTIDGHDDWRDRFEIARDLR